MNSTVIVAVISFLGTLVGTAGGIITSAKLIEYRLSQLEKKVDANSKSTAKIPVIEERLSAMNRRVKLLERSSSYPIEIYDNSLQ